MKIDSKLLTFIRRIATIIILLFGAYYVSINLDSFYVLLEVNWISIAIMTILFLVTGFASASENAVLYQTIGAKIGYFESFGLTNVSAFFSLVIPQGGSITKAIYLKQKYGIPFSQTPALFLGLIIITLVIGAGLMLISILVTVLVGGTVSYLLWIFGFIACASGLLFMLDIPQVSLTKLGNIGSLITNFSSAWKNLRTNKPSLINACAWQLFTFISYGILISTAYYSLGIRVNPFLGISLAVLLSITNIFVFVPGNLGIQEFIFGYVTYVSGFLFFQGVVMGTLIRIIDILLTLMLMPFSWYFLFYRQNIKINQ